MSTHLASKQITSICFSPDGKTVAGGLIQGKVYFYDLVDFDQLKYKTQMDCRNSGGKYSRGTKVTGMCYRPMPGAGGNAGGGGGAGQGGSGVGAYGGGMGGLGNSSGGLGGGDSDNDNNSGIYKWRRNANTRNSAAAMQQQAQLLVSTNDSRLRLCRLDDYSLVCKYKGLRNKSMQIKASFSSDGSHVICGSENGAVHIWRTQPRKKSALSAFMSVGGNTNRNDAYETFDCTSSAEVATTVAVFAPVDSVFAHLYNNTHILSASTAVPVATNQQPHHGSRGTRAATVTAGSSMPAAAAEASLRTPAEYSTRIVITADYEGSLRVFFRLS